MGRGSSVPSGYSGRQPACGTGGFAARFRSSREPPRDLPGSRRAGLCPELVPCVEVLEVLPTVNDPAVLELDDDAVVNVQVLAGSVCSAALNANHTGFPHCSDMLQLSPNGPSGLRRELTEVRQGCL